MEDDDARKIEALLETAIREAEERGTDSVWNTLEHSGTGPLNVTERVAAELPAATEVQRMANALCEFIHSHEKAKPKGSCLCGLCCEGRLAIKFPKFHQFAIEQGKGENQ